MSSEEAGDLELEITPVDTLEEAIESLKEGELDLLAMPARLLHGKQIKLLEAGCQVLGARAPRRPARFLVSENRIWYQPKGAIILCDDKIIRRQLKRARRGLRLLSSKAYASIHEIEDRPDSEDEIARWMEKLRRNGDIDGFVTSREVFNSIHCSSRRTVLGIDPEEREGDRYLPVPYADLVVLIGRSGFPKKIIQKIGIIGDGLTGKLTTIALFRLGYPVEIIGKKSSKSSASVASISISNDSFKFLKELKINNLEKICNPINTIKLYENHNNYLDPDSIFFNKTNLANFCDFALKFSRQA